MLTRLIIFLLTVTLGITATSAQTSAPFRVYLAFEDGPTAAYTPDILDTLAAHGARATFVISGAQIAGNEAILQREVREGHALINHLWEEPGVYAGAPDQAVIESYLRTEAAIRVALGDQLAIYDAQTKMFWQPGGAAQPLPAIDGVSAITYNWNVNSDDCGWGMPTDMDLDTVAFDQGVIANILGEPVSIGRFHNPHNAYDYGDGVIIIFHDLNRVTNRVLPVVLTELRSAGASFEPLPRPWDAVNTIPVRLGAAPDERVPGVAGYRLTATTTEPSRLRAMPGLDGAILTTVEPGTALIAVGRAPGWVEVEYEGGTAWIARQLVTMRGAIPNLPLRSG